MGSTTDREKYFVKTLFPEATYFDLLQSDVFEHLYAHSKYSDLDYSISYWRTTSQIEVDFILGNHKVAIEVKGTNNVQTRLG